jgi:hypothetical protein
MDPTGRCLPRPRLRKETDTVSETSCSLEYWKMDKDQKWVIPRIHKFIYKRRCIIWCVIYMHTCTYEHQQYSCRFFVRLSKAVSHFDGKYKWHVFEKVCGNICIQEEWSKCAVQGLGFESHSMHGCLCVCVVLCVGSDLATRWSTVQGSSDCV